MTRTVKPAAVKLLEVDVTKQVKDFLAYRNWRMVRMNVTTIQDRYGNWTQFGEKGMADYLAIYYLRDRVTKSGTGVNPSMWIEFKRPKGKAEDNQAAWRDKEAAKGAIVLLVNDFGKFEAWYERVWGWLHTEDWVPGQKALTFEEPVTKTSTALPGKGRHVASK